MFCLTHTNAVRAVCVQWDVDEEALAESDAQELAFAVRSLANTRMDDWM